MTERITLATVDKAELQEQVVRLRTALLEVQHHVVSLHARAARQHSSTLARGLELVASITEDALEAA